MTNFDHLCSRFQYLLQLLVSTLLWSIPCTLCSRAVLSQSEYSCCSLIGNDDRNILLFLLRRIATKQHISANIWLPKYEHKKYVQTYICILCFSSSSFSLCYVWGAIEDIIQKVPLMYTYETKSIHIMYRKPLIHTTGTHWMHACFHMCMWGKFWIMSLTAPHMYEWTIRILTVYCILHWRCMNALMF